jgi:hypothetical protein
MTSLIDTHNNGDRSPSLREAERVAEAGWLMVHGRRLRKKLDEVGAVSEVTAKTISELGLNNREVRTLRRNVLIGKIEQTKDERFYVPVENRNE